MHHFLKLLLSFGLMSFLCACAPQGDLDAANKKIIQLEAELVQLKAKQNTDLNKMTAPLVSPASATAEAVSVKTLESEETSSQWHYLQKEDPMDGTKTFSASNKSLNEVNLGSPYSGGQNGRIVLRESAKNSKDIMFTIEKGQILCNSYDHCSVLVRFDDEKPMTFSGIGPADHSSTVVFLQGYKRFLDKLAKAKIVRISVNIYHEGSPVFEFDVSGFDMNKFKPIEKK